MGDIDDITYNADDTVTVHYKDGTSVTSEQTGSGASSGGSDSGGGIWGSIFGAIPGILSALFPTGVNGSNNYPTVTPGPAGTTVTMPGSNTTNLLVIAVAILVLYILFATKTPGTAKI